MQSIAREIRGDVVAMSHAKKTPHLGSSLSCVDIVVAAYWGGCASIRNSPGRPERDRFILSKGHAATTLYAALARRGFCRRRAAGNLQLRRQPPGRTSRPRAACRALRQRPVRSATACRWRWAWRLAQRIQGTRLPLLRADERRRVRGRVGLGGGPVCRRHRSSTRCRRNHRLQQVAGHRSQRRSHGTRPLARQMARLRLDRPRGRWPRHGGAR